MKIARYLELHKLTGRELARRCGISANTIYNLRREKQNPTYEVILKIEAGTAGNVTRYDIHENAYQMWPKLI